MVEISGDRRENELGKSEKVEERENDKNKEEEDENGAAELAVAVAERNSAANRWPQQETMALLRIRSEMDFAFRDSGSKSPLWDEISRRMAELGYHRSAKKCKEKFENIYKYHRRLKNCSYDRTNRKAYRFFDQLEALGHQQSSFQTSASEPADTSMNDTAYVVSPISSHPQCVPQMTMPTSVNLDSFTISTSTTSNSGSESEGARTKKRKWADFFDILMKSVLEKQEALQNKFLEALDKHEHERQAREEAWKMQQMDRIKKEQELLMQERSISAAKDAAIAFLQKVLEQGKISGTSEQVLEKPSQEMSIVGRKEKDNGESSSSRWPKEEVETLIKIKTNMELEYQRVGPKGPMWEEISTAMKNFGYDRNAKRCKEKWENINKYYRRVKDGNKQRHADSKTCPYFPLLDQLHNIKSKRLDNNSENSGSNLRPEELLLHMMNHHSRQQQQEQVALQQDQGGLTKQDSKVNHVEGTGNDAERAYQVVTHNPLSVNV
ncbi:trihelix transcription factor GT-2-like [Chenopodium quinoa]|uniref:Myb-like domain-containing protein n=1 Tax=Chenopodium quinoa TaxID=63459 RepID=A0A803KX67_CHEQI|nr:trihelix transcription factor GT-2-like [Chenopodium quinoa]